MRNHKKLYRSITASLLMLFAGLVLAPTMVTAGFHAATKKVAAPTEPTSQAAFEQTWQVAFEPTAPTAAHQEQERSTRFADPAHDEPPVPQAEPEPTGHGQHTGPTTFAIADFEPVHGGGSVFSRGGAGLAGVDVAIASSGGNITKVTRKPNPPTGDGQASNDQTGNGQPDTTGAPGNGKPADSTPPGAGGDQHDDPAAEGEQHHDQPDTQLGDNHSDSPIDNHDDRPHVSVPEPSSIWLLVAGIIGLVIARRRSQSVSSELAQR